MDDKRAISKDLGWEHFTRLVRLALPRLTRSVTKLIGVSAYSLLESPSVLIREQAAGCLRNFVGGSGDAEPVVQGIGAEKLSQILERLLDSAHVETTVHVRICIQWILSVTQLISAYPFL